MHFVKTGVLASALLAASEALTINRAHLRAHRAASRDVGVEARAPQDKIVVVHTTVIKYVKSFQKPTKKVQDVQPAPVQPTPVLVAAVASVQVQAPPPSSVQIQEAAKSPVPEPVKEEPKKEEPKKEEPKKEEPKVEPAKGTAPAVSGGKRGLVYAGNDVNFVSQLAQGGKCSWSYNWGSSKPSNAPASLEYVPMCWSKAKCQGNWEKDVNAAIASGSKAVLSFNEPDVPAQANRSPSEAAAEHKELFNSLRGRVRIGSPAISSEGNNPNRGVPWLSNFIKACGSDCPIDFCAVHMYAFNFGALGKDIEYLDTFLKAASSACNNKPLWLTEISVADSSDAVQSQFMDLLIPFLESNPLVERYSYFMANNHEWSGLVHANLITSAGKKYASGY